MDLISAGGTQAARAALSALDGRLHERINHVKDELLSLAAHLSAWADYPEDEIPEVDEEEIAASLTNARQELSALLNEYDTGRTLREGVSTVIIGRPNVGKSTLMNLLAGCERSIVTSVPGTTRDVIEETVMLGDVPLRLWDTAGIRSTDDPVESIGVQRAKERLKRAGLIFAVFDASEPLSEEDRELLSMLREVPSVAIVNKTDLPACIELDELREKTGELVCLSAKNGEGLEELTEVVSRLLGTAALDPSQGLLATERQRADAQASLASVEEALSVLKSGMTFDAVTVVLEEAIDHLMELTGERVSEAVVDRVFSRFCVGK